MHDNTYLYQRLKEIGVPPDQAKRYGLSSDQYGNILIEARTFTGEPVTYQTINQARQLKRVTDRKTNYQPHTESLETIYRRTRYNPTYLEANPDVSKYRAPKGVNAPPFPMPNAIQAHQERKKGGTVYFIEGELKAAAMDARGLEAVAFSGNQMYRVCKAVADYLEARQPDKIVILYDADADQLKPKADRITDRTRIAGFENSADRFAGQLFTLFDQVGHQARIYFSMVRPDSLEKGIDDVLSAAPDPAAVIADLEALDKAHTHFFTFRLPKDQHKRKKRIRTNLGGKTYRDFYRKFAGIIGREPFRHDRIEYQTKDGNADRLRTLTDPFAVPIERTRHTIKKYLSEITTEIDQALNENTALAIAAPTGSGKTTFFIDQAKRTGRKVVICVPTVAQVDQLTRPGVVGISGTFDQAKTQRAINSPVIVCTYDTLHHITDIHRRTLVIDEAHNLINQYGKVRYMRKEFRAETLRRLLEITPEARQTVYISGTMPETLCAALSLPLIEIRRTESPTVIVRPIETEKAGPKHLQTALISQLRKEDFLDGFCRVVFYNDKAAAELIREQLRDQLEPTGKEIAVISRDHYNAGEHTVLDHITSCERIPANVGLLICTCLLSEGVNIQNRNIGNVYTVGLRSVSSFRQFVARFRKIDRLEVCDIKGPETDPKREFSILAADQLRDDTERAELQAKQSNRNSDSWRKNYNDGEAEYLEEIENVKAYEYRPGLFDLIYLDQLNQARPDVLRILAEIEQRKEDTGNNAYYYTQLEKAPEITILEANAAEADQDTTEAVNVAQDAQNAAEREALERTRDQLTDNPGPVVSALHSHYQQTGNRHGRADLEKLAPDLIDQTTEAAALEYLETYRADLKTKNVRQLIRDFCRLHFTGIDQTAKAAYLEDYNRTRAALHWKIIRRQTELQLYRDRNKRKRLNDLHRLEISAYRFLSDRIEDKGKREYTADQLRATVAEIFTRTRYTAGDLENPIREQLVNITEAKAAQMVRELFDLEERRTQTGKAYRIVQKWTKENMHFLQTSDVPIMRKPLKILALWRK